MPTIKEDLISITSLAILADLITSPTLYLRMTKQIEKIGENLINNVALAFLADVASPISYSIINRVVLKKPLDISPGEVFDNFMVASYVYTFRNFMREELEHPWFGGALGGATKYYLKGNSASTGALNNFIYEFGRDELKPIFEHYLPEIIAHHSVSMLAEGLDGIMKTVMTGEISVLNVGSEFIDGATSGLLTSTIVESFYETIATYITT
jgi:hypothetical protein